LNSKNVLIGSLKVGCYWISFLGWRLVEPKKGFWTGLKESVLIRTKVGETKTI